MPSKASHIRNQRFLSTARDRRRRRRRRHLLHLRRKKKSKRQSGASGTCINTAGSFP